MYQKIVTARRLSNNTYVRYVAEDKRFSQEIRAMNWKPFDIAWYLYERESHGKPELFGSV